MKYNYFIKPFHYTGGIKLLIAAVATAIAGGIVAELVNVHFTGILNLKFVNNPIFSYSQIAESVFITTVFGLLTLVAGYLLKKRVPRFIDVWATLGVARLPLMISMVFFPAFGIDQEATIKLLENMQENPNAISGPLQKLMLFAACALPFIIYTVYLHYHAFSVCTNSKGTRAVLSFILLFIIAEIIIQFTYGNLFTHNYEY